MEYDTKLIKFCERKLYPDRPEYINAFSALYMCCISYHNLSIVHKLINTNYFPKTQLLIYWCIFINGLASFLYHWYSWYIFKLFDEFSMIIPVWLGISNILIDLNYSIYSIGIFTTFNMILLILDVFMWFDEIFPIFFTLELLILFPLFYQTVKYNNEITRINILRIINNDGSIGITMCCVSGMIWGVTEKYCNNYLVFGHAIWHIGISTGLCYIIQYFCDNLHNNNIGQQPRHI
jgi:hypothetical protein